MNRQRPACFCPLSPHPGLCIYCCEAGFNNHTWNEYLVSSPMGWCHPHVDSSVGHLTSTPSHTPGHVGGGEYRRERMGFVSSPKTSLSQPKKLAPNSSCLWLCVHPQLPLLVSR
jgi:hypothetical protein